MASTTLEVEIDGTKVTIEGNSADVLKVQAALRERVELKKRLAEITTGNRGYDVTGIKPMA